MVHMAWQGPELGLEFLALPQGACDILIPSRFAGITSGKPIAPWTLIQDPSKLSDLPAPPGQDGEDAFRCFWKMLQFHFQLVRLVEHLGFKHSTLNLQICPEVVS
eukprot:g11023.t1